VQSDFRPEQSRRPRASRRAFGVVTTIATGDFDMPHTSTRDLMWPALALADWQPTYETLHRWSQVPGKVCLALSPPQNHAWQVAFAVTARGLRSRAIPHGSGSFDFQFDLVDHGLLIETHTGARRAMPLVSRSVAEFHAELMQVLAGLGIDVHIWDTPVEMADPVPFDEDHGHRTYDPEQANRFFRALTQADQAFKSFASSFVGKQSPSHFFWGSFDLAQTRFSGRRAPQKPNADRVTREAYSHEVFSVGFWPGAAQVCDASFYAYAAPEPEGFRDAAAAPASARYVPELGEFLLPYADVRQADQPRAQVLKFCQSAYAACATLGGWDRGALERTTAWTDIELVAPV